LPEGTMTLRPMLLSKRVRTKREHCPSKFPALFQKIPC
jgi:hypothetical protein